MAVDAPRIPAPLPPAPAPILAVGHYAASSVDAEDFSRRLGNWGSAARLIGARWEPLAVELLRRRLPWQAPLGGGRSLAVLHVLALDADPVAGAALQRAGVSAPDLLAVGHLGSAPRGKLAVRAVDCKVSLDTAEREQTAPARLQRSFEQIRRRLPMVAEALRRQVQALGDAPAATRAIEHALRGQWDDVLAAEGLFVAPDSGFNRWFLAQLEARRRTGAPLGRLPLSGPRRPPADVRGPVDPSNAWRLELPAHLEPIAALEFLGDLEGWPEAGVAAQLDGVELDHADLAVAERCWRVGAGLRGAVLALRRPLFRPGIALGSQDGRPAPDVTAMLRQVAARRRAANSAELITAVAHSVERRRQLWDREWALLAAPLSYNAWLEQLGASVRDERSRSGGAPFHPEATHTDAAPAGAPPIAAVDEDGAGAAQVEPQGAAQSAEPFQSPRALYREMTDRHRGRVVAAAAALYRQGAEETAVLDELESRADEWRDASVADAAALSAGR
jgi:hypothetical protein